MNILIFGATGSIGNHLFNSYSKLGYNVYVYPEGQGYGKPYNFISIDTSKF